MRILMVAAENDALPGGKVGGIGDVLRDIPVALAGEGHNVDVVTPGYGAFSRLPGAEHAGDVQLYFAGFPQLVSIFRVPARTPCDGVTLWAMEHPLFASCGEGKIYCDDGPQRPFATDATKFALFGLATCRALEQDFFGQLDVLHLHDWHAAMVALLARLDPQFARLQSLHSVFTVHNLALQGTRPLQGDDSSPARWFRHLSINDPRVVDPRATSCINPMRVGINLCDRVHVVSPNYANEIVRASELTNGLAGGEGLHEDLHRAREEGRLHGILNGCDYDARIAGPLSWPGMLDLLEREIGLLVANQQNASSSHLLAWRAVDRFRRAAEAGRQAPMLLTSVGRLTAQKVDLLRQVVGSGETALAQLLNELGDTGVFVMLGSGDPALEQLMTEHMAGHSNFIYLCGYSEPVSQALYASGELFMMPSTYEPCGISQMLAMRAGQPCFVHSVGGLADTVVDGKTGFAFSGTSLGDSAASMLQRFAEVLALRKNDAASWKKVAQNAAAARFSWQQAAREYTDKLYQR